MNDIKIRAACVSDAEALLKIYSHYVENTAVSFEYETPSSEEFSSRIMSTIEKYPYIVAEREGKILGYAYAGCFKPRKAYDRCVEVSIYLDMNERGNGVGRKLYTELERLLAEMGILNIYACITNCETEDEYLTQQSPLFHSKMGYKKIGHFSKCGFKFGRWYDMIWMEKFIGEHSAVPLPVKMPITE